MSNIKCLHCGLLVWEKSKCQYPDCPLQSDNTEAIVHGKNCYTLGTHNCPADNTEHKEEKPTKFLCNVKTATEIIELAKKENVHVIIVQDSENNPLKLELTTEGKEEDSWKEVWQWTWDNNTATGEDFNIEMQKRFTITRK